MAYLRWDESTWYVYWTGESQLSIHYDTKRGTMFLRSEIKSMLSGEMEFFKIPGWEEESDDIEKRKLVDAMKEFMEDTN